MLRPAVEVSFLGQLVQHLIVVAPARVPQRGVSVLVQCPAAVDGRVVAQELPDDLQLGRVALGNVLGDGARAAMVDALQDDVSAADEALVGVEVEVREEEADGEGVAVEGG